MIGLLYITEQSVNRADSATGNHYVENFVAQRMPGFQSPVKRECVLKSIRRNITLLFDGERMKTMQCTYNLYLLAFTLSLEHEVYV